MTGDSVPRLRALAPLSEPTFRRIWSASLLSNLAQLVLGVAAAWEMTRLTNSPQMVALVQTALMLPLMLISVPAGAVADMFDRRKIALTGLAFSCSMAGLLALLSAQGLAGPWLLLAFCSLIGAGVALYSPSWQASIPEQVSAEHLPAAIALGSVSYNIARSFGPALGGALVVSLGASAVFGVTALSYLPLLLAIFAWNRPHIPPRLPPERLDRAIISGARYAVHSRLVRAVMLRAGVYGFAIGGSSALTPLIARDVLHGNAGTYGILLGAGGVGAVFGAMFVSDAREKMSADVAIGLCMVVTALAIGTVAFSPWLTLTCAALFLSGAANMVVNSLLNVAVQVSVPRWVTARALAWFASSLTGGVSLGAWVWGNVASRHGLSEAVAASALFMALLPLMALVSPMPRVGNADLAPGPLPVDPEVSLDITGRSGPIIIELEYRVHPDNARGFYGAMLGLQHARKRNGAFGWRLSRDIAARHVWIEHFEFPTWQDYLRHRDRFTAADRKLQSAVAAFCEPGSVPEVQRRLERPFGSVRWKADTPDPEKTT